MSQDLQFILQLYSKKTKYVILFWYKPHVAQRSKSVKEVPSVLTICPHVSLLESRLTEGIEINNLFQGP